LLPGSDIGLRHAASAFVFHPNEIFWFAASCLPRCQYKALFEIDLDSPRGSKRRSADRQGAAPAEAGPCVKKSVSVK
jgi:hypothetical protein